MKRPDAGLDLGAFCNLALQYLFRKPQQRAANNLCFSNNDESTIQAFITFREGGRGCDLGVNNDVMGGLRTWPSKQRKSKERASSQTPEVLVKKIG